MNKQQSVQINWKRNRREAKQSVLFCLLLLIFVFSFQLPYIPEDILSATPSRFGDAVWMHVDTFQTTEDKTLDNLVDYLRLTNIQKVIILGKNIDGVVPYSSKTAIQSTQNQAMQRLVSSLKNHGLKVYFYFPVNTDPLWLQKHPEDTAFQVGKASQTDLIPDPEKKLVNLTSNQYCQYISNLCLEAIQTFSLDGIQLDYIRYRNGQFGFSDIERKKAETLGINLMKIQDLTYQTFVKPGDWKTLLQYYDQKDPDVLRWAKLREDIISDFIVKVKKTVNEKTMASIGITLVSSGATSEAYTAIHFGQNWERLSGIADFATPMAYHGSNPDPYQFVQGICQGTLQKINPKCAVSIGIQAHATSTENLFQAIQAVKDCDLSFCLFRIGTFAFSHLEIQPAQSVNLQCRLYWFNGCENQIVEAISIEKTGCALKLADQSISLFPDKPDIIKWHLSSSYKTGEIGSEMIELATQWEKASKSCLPQIVVYTKNNMIPTLQHSSHRIDQLIYSLSSSSSTHNEKQLTGSLFKVIRDQTWVNLMNLPPKLSIHLQQNNNIYSLWDNQNGLKIQYYQDYAVIQKRIRSNWMEVEKLPLHGEVGWLPVKCFFPFFRFHIYFNPTLKLVHILRWTPLYPNFVALSSQNILNSNSLLLTDQAVWFEWGEYFQTSFYAFSRQIHEQGLLVFLWISVDQVKVEYPETRWFMMQSSMKKSDIPDEFVYWLESWKDLNYVSKNRKAFLPYSAILYPIDKTFQVQYRWNSKQPLLKDSSLPLVWIRSEKDPLLEISDLSILYHYPGTLTTVNWLYTKQFEK